MFFGRIFGLHLYCIEWDLVLSTPSSGFTFNVLNGISFGYIFVALVAWFEKAVSLSVVGGGVFHPVNMSLARKLKCPALVCALYRVGGGGNHLSCGW